MKKRPLHFKLLQLHRWIGLASAILVLVLAVTGILLEHTDDLGLDDQFIQSQALLNTYGIEPDPVTSFATSDKILSHSGTYLYFDEQPVSSDHYGICGALLIKDSYAICTPDGIVVLDKDGDMIEVLSSDFGLPTSPSGLGMTSSNQIVLLSNDGNWLGDNSLFLWQPYDDTPSHVSKSTETPSQLKYAIHAHNISHEISWERILLDLHSGRLFGKAGVYAMDLAALGMIYLSLSGCWVWWKRRRR